LVIICDMQVLWKRNLVSLLGVEKQFLECSARVL